MTKKRLKNVGLTYEVWKELKILTVDRNCTMSEAVSELLHDSGQRNKEDYAGSTVYLGGMRAAPATLMEIQADSGEDFWTDINRYTLTAVTLVLKLQPDSPAFNIEDMIALLSDFDQLRVYINRIRPEDSKYHREGMDWLYSYLRNWLKNDEDGWNYSQYKTLTQGLISKLSASAHSEYLSIVNTYAPDVGLKEPTLNNERKKMKLSILGDSRSDSFLATQVARNFFSDVEVHVTPGEFHAGLKGDRLPDLILIDVHGGYLHNGIGELASIREQYTAASLIPIVIVTASTDAALHAFARDQGANAVIIKPITVAKLESVIDALLPERAIKGA